MKFQLHFQEALAPSTGEQLTTEKNTYDKLVLNPKVKQAVIQRNALISPQCIDDLTMVFSWFPITFLVFIYNFPCFPMKILLKTLYYLAKK